MSCRVLKNKNYKITNRYGNGHSGVDVVGEGNTIDIVVAHTSGKIVFCQKGQTHNPGSKGNASYGNCVKIKHDNGMYTLYAHLDDVRVSLGQYVKQGQELGRMGNTGNSYGAHLHFEVWNNQNIRIKPEPYLNNNLDYNNLDYTGTITYQAYANGRWYKEVTKCDNTNEGYAGDGINYISGFRCKPVNGEIIYEAHQLNGHWLGEVNSKDYITNDKNNGLSYAGIYGTPIDAIRIKSTKGYVDYRVKTKKGWLPWVRGFSDKIYAGNYGEPILGIQMK